MVKKIRAKGIEINFSNKLFYVFIVIGVSLAIGAGVYAAAGTVPAFGHSHAEIQPCGNDEILKMDGTAWVCEADGGSDTGTDYCSSGTCTGPLIVSGSVTAKSFIYDSDITLKENIQVIPNALDKVMALEGVSFEWIADESDDSNLGFIAQDVERVLPEVVSTGSDGLKAVEYGNIVAVLVEAIKEQQKEIDELKLKLDN